VGNDDGREVPVTRMFDRPSPRRKAGSRRSPAAWAPACVGMTMLILSGCGAGSRLKVGAAPEGEVIEAVGEVMNDPSNIEETRKKSLVDAQKKAVEMVVGLHLSAKTM